MFKAGHGRSLKWLESAGGPIVAIPNHDVLLWSGSFGHYDLACHVEDVGVVSVHDEPVPFVVLVLWDEPYSTAIVPELSMIVQWRYADSEESLLRLISNSLSWVRWSPIGEMVIPEGMSVFDAALSGDQLEGEDSLEFPAIAGESVVEVGELADERTSARLVRLRSVST